MLIAIDPSTSSLGFAVYERPLRSVADGCIKFEYSSPLDYLSQVVDFLDHMHAEYGITEVATERTFVDKFQGNTAALLNVSVDQIESWCEAAEVPFEKFANSTVKKQLTGKGNADKKDVLFAVQEYLSKESQTLPVPKGKTKVAAIFDVADAHAIAHTYLVRNKRPPKLNPA